MGSTWDQKPCEALPKRKFEFASTEVLKGGLSMPHSPGEFELIKAMGRLHSGDYTGAVRNAVTALEVLLEAELKNLLIEDGDETKASKKLRKLNYFQRVEEYEKLSGRIAPHGLFDNVRKARDLRHEIVHDGKNISYGDRGDAHFAVDMSRFAYQWLENSDSSQQRRGRLLVQSQLGGHHNLFPTKITAEGVVVSPIPIPAPPK
jgi:hypothetical protein